MHTRSVGKQSNACLAMFAKELNFRRGFFWQTKKTWKSHVSLADADRGACTEMEMSDGAIEAGDVSAEADNSSAPFEFVARLNQLSRDDARLQVEIRGRHLMLLRRADEVFAIDATCYHMGAPLLHGDVEDVPGHGACITCPWHHYQISLNTGERLYTDMQKKTCTLPKKQRVHSTKIVDGTILVKLSGGGKPSDPPAGTPAPKPHELPKLEWESDRYAFKAPPPSQKMMQAGGRGRVRSGHALRGGRGAGFVGNTSGLHPGLRGQDVGGMVAHSMRGGDGKAPWAMKGGGEVPSPPKHVAPMRPPATRMAAPPELEETQDTE